MILNLVTAYNELIGKSKKVEVGLLGNKPETCSDIITPDSECIVKDNFFGEKVTFGVDANGMEEVLRDIQITEEDKDLLKILIELHNKINNYFGGKNTNNMERIQEYVSGGFKKTLSQIKGKTIGQCAEKAAVTHNVLKTIIHTGHIKSYDSRFVSSRLNNSPHAFVLLENIAQKDGKSFIFDIENPAEISANGTTISVIGLYPITREQLNDFLEGKSIKLKCVYDGISGCKEEGTDRFYGNQMVQLPNFNADARID